MKIFGLVLKCIATAMLVSALILLSVFMLAMSPLYLALIVKGKAKASTIIQIIPVAIIAGIVWKMWKPEGMSANERAYYDGIIAGQVKASRVVGMMEGARMIAQPEDLRLKPVYSTRAKSKSKEVIPF